MNVISFMFVVKTMYTTEFSKCLLLSLLLTIGSSRNAGESGEITVSHLLLGIWSQEESAGHKIMATFGFDDEKAKELAKSVSS